MTIDLDAMSNKLKISMSNILNIYIYGSRLWNPSAVNSKSDIDVIIIVNLKIGKMCTHVDNIDATIYDVTTFATELNDNKFIPIVTQFLPQCKLQEKHKFKITINKRKLAKSVSDEIGRDIALYKKLIGKQNDMLANKVLKCSLRMAHICNDILNGNEIDLCVPHELTLDELIKLHRGISAYCVAIYR
jgi:hypothetical protein